MLTKLKIKEELPLWLLNLPVGVSIDTKDIDVHTSLGTQKQLVQLLLFAEDKAVLDKWLNKILPRLADKAVFWVAYPQKSGRIQSDLIRNEGWDKVFDNGYRIVSSAGINADWTAVRISKIDANRIYKSSVPVEERKIPGIDYVNRTVELPPDARKAMKPFKGLEDFFNTMSFTHKKENVEAIEGAMKPETRQRRIEKMIMMVLAMQEKKEKKK